MCLKKHGISCEIFETRSEEYQHGGNIALAPNALRVMDHVGIYDSLQKSGFNYEELAFTNGAGEVLGKFLNGSQKNYHFPALRIHRVVLREQLLEEVKRQGIPIHWNKKCVHVSGESSSSATVLFEDGNVVEANFIVGTDGIHSRIRGFVAPDTEPHFSGLMGVMGTVAKSQLKSLQDGQGHHLPCMLFGASGSFAIMPSSFDGEEIGYFATIEAEDRGREGWNQLDKNGNEMKSMLEERFLPDNLRWPALVRSSATKHRLILFPAGRK